MKTKTSATQHPPAPDYAWHTWSVELALSKLDSRLDGLTHREAEQRRARYGVNELSSQSSVSALRLFANQFANVLTALLLVAALLSAALGHDLEAAAITVIILFAVLLGFAQEYRAERALEALRRLAAPTALVWRDGNLVELPARDLVPGDIVLLQAGAKVPADGRLLEAVNLQVEEAALTGESLPVLKQTEPLSRINLPLGDRRNLVYGGTLVTQGRGRALIIATGMDSEFGRIVRLIQQAEPRPTPLQVNLDRVGRRLAQAALLLVAIVMALGVWRGADPIEMLIFSIALAVAVVPEALPAVVTISLSIGAQRLLHRHALIRQLAAVETLGSTSVICSDKTGTLTKDEMTARQLLCADTLWRIEGVGYAPEGRFYRDEVATAPDAAVLDLLQAAALASDAELSWDAEAQQWRLRGDPTEGALLSAAAKAGLNPSALAMQWPRIGEIAFSSESKRMTTLHRGPEGAVLAYVKGAPEVVLAACDSQSDGTPLLAAQRAALLTQAQTMAAQALRVLAVARRHDATLENAEHGLQCLGLIGLMDPPRPEARAAIQRCRQAGIRVVMISGDHPQTAQAVATELGLLDQQQRVVDGTTLDLWDAARLNREVAHIGVYARVSPAHKLRVVRALQHHQHITAMTGDGVNDAPALKQADIGIAMGLTGTDVSKEAAAMLLTDDNFASIVAAVEEGRAIFGNIKKYLMYLLSSNLGEIGLIAGAALWGLPLPLSAVQILYVNLATDGLPALALAVDPPERDLMQRPPRRGGLFTRPVVGLMLLGGIWSSAVNLGLFVWCLNHDYSVPHAMSLVFISLVLIQLLKAYNFRSDRHSMLRGLWRNRWLNYAVLWESALLLLVVSQPDLQAIFGIVTLSSTDAALVLAAAFSVCPCLELGKWAVRRGWLGATD